MAGSNCFLMPQPAHAPTPPLARPPSPHVHLWLGITLAAGLKWYWVENLDCKATCQAHGMQLLQAGSPYVSACFSPDPAPHDRVLGEPHPPTRWCPCER